MILKWTVFQVNKKKEDAPHPEIFRFFNNVQCAPTEVGTMVPFHGQIYIWLAKTITDNSSINLMNLHIECNSNFKEKRSGTKKKGN